MDVGHEESVLWISTLEIDAALLGRIAEKARPFRVIQTGEGDGDAVPLQDVKIWATYGDDVSTGILRCMPQLRWIQLLQSGYDRVPVDELRRRGIRMTTTHGVHAGAVAEYVLFMTLYFLRDMAHFQRLQVIRRWDRSITGTELAGKVLAVVGTGAIGKEIARRASAFGMKTIGINRSARPSPCFEQVVGIQNLDWVLSEADVVVSTLPGGLETRHFWNRERLEKLQRDAVFINVGRGSSVDTEGLLSVVRRGGLKGVALDVFEQEPLPALHPLWNTPGVVLTPHMAAKTREYLSRAVSCFLENLDRYRRGLHLVHEIAVQ
ncbi:D-2-hydroxyacid dehydrogenase [Kyrpidia spormannii]|uniref:Hydroxyacid dehydrogenase n=2 Tax=Kyrpidia spormannii TaxID=2055160 RepID=A0ACA8Z9S9_9BACL|nr:D-2-hydroxyacid dehydrogenase [Kyrpidia spormannii]CAB3393031.1 Hydroxyacid dehydrogenase [Kyrpidia spormannii]CAB3393950.1 Hydroxyacid dehydrogenase [Kyrpidia spormannii]